MAKDDARITLPRRPFTEVHELVYLFHSWQLVLDADDIPAALRPLRDIPEHLAPVMSRMLIEARAQLESAQAGTDIALRFAADRDFAELMQWGAVQLKEIEESLGDGALDPTWQRALRLAGDLVSAALSELDGTPLSD